MTLTVLTILSFIIIVNCTDLRIRGNLRLSLTSESTFLCPDSFYYFRCQIIECSHLIWSLNDEKLVRVVTSSTVDDFSPEDPINILLQSIMAGSVEHETNFTSYLWFNSSLITDRGNRLNLTCTSDSSSLTITLDDPGNIKSPSGVNVSAHFNESNGEVMVICYWEYNDDPSSVAYFDVEIRNEDTVVDFRRVLNGKREETFVFQYENGSNYSAVVTTVGHCNNSLKTTKQFQHDMFIIDQEKGKCPDIQEKSDDGKQISTGTAIVIGVVVGAVGVGILGTLAALVICIYVKKRGSFSLQKISAKLVRSRSSLDG